MTTSLTILLLIFQVFCVVIPLINKTKHTNWDKAVIFFSIICFGLSIAIFINSQDDNDEKEKQAQLYQSDLKTKLAERDSLHQMKDSIQTEYFTKKLDSSYLKSIKSSNEALAKYNLILIDSMQTVANKINIKSINRPQLILTASELGSTPPVYIENKDGQTFINIKFMSENNISYNLNVKYYLLACHKLNGMNYSYSTIDTGDLFYKRAMLAQNRFATAQILLKPEFKDFDCVFILMVGKFSEDFENKTQMPFKDLVIFDIKNNKISGAPDNDFLENVIISLKRRNIIH